MKYGDRFDPLQTAWNRIQPVYGSFKRTFRIDFQYGRVGESNAAVGFHVKDFFYFAKGTCFFLTGLLHFIAKPILYTYIMYIDGLLAWIIKI